jgi:hypothetical protein
MVPVPFFPLGYVAATLAVFVGGRLIGDMIIYGAVPGMHGLQAWSHIVIAPMLFLMLAAVLAPGLSRSTDHESKQRRQPVDLRIPLVLSLLLSAAVSGLWMSGRLDRFRGNPVPKTWPVYADQLAEIRRHIPLAEHYEVILLPEFHLYPFMDRSHVAYEWWHGLPAKRKAEVASEIAYAVIPKTKTTQDDVRLLSGDHVVVFQTKNYLLLRRKS